MSKNTTAITENDWKIVSGQIKTKWAADVDPNMPLPDYPRPQFVRKEWMNLNGLWNYAVCSKKIEMVENFDGKILVPYPIESALSGVGHVLKPKERLWYKREFKIPDSWKGNNVILHFGAVDWETAVYINKKLIGTHKGGHVPFSFDISEYLSRDGNDTELIVKVRDPTNKGGVERGKQTLRPSIIKYTSVSGIWQTVWLEPVPKSYIKDIKILPDIDEQKLEISSNIINSEQGDTLTISVKNDGNEVAQAKIDVGEDSKVKIDIPNPILWSPDSPFLYDMTLTLERAGKLIDTVDSYFGMRKISMGKDANGRTRLKLNNEILFHYGPLDQGWWPDGLYTAPTDEALKWDIEITKKMGFNMIRKHVKVEPARWYYHCDKIGMLVWQDMPSGGKMGLLQLGTGVLLPNMKHERRHKKEDKQNFLNELESMINSFYNYPSIVVWVPFNEAWGQFETEKVVDFTRNLDNSRLIDAASGFFDYGKNVGDILDAHIYVTPEIPKHEPSDERALVCGEFGGVGMKVENHMWKIGFRFSQGRSPDSEALQVKYTTLIEKLIEIKKEGLSAAVYTQTTDIEGEINGLITYDREVIKIPVEKLNSLHTKLINQ